MPNGTIWVTVPTRQLIRAYDPTGKVIKEIQGGDDPGLPFDRPMGIAYDKNTDTLVIADLENRLVRLPAK